MKVLYRALDCSTAILFPHRLNWNAWVTTNAGIFCLDRVLTQDQLKKRGRALANSCFLCCQEGEVVDLLVVHCAKASMLWQLMLAIVGVSCVFPRSVCESLFTWQGSFVGKKCQKT